MKKIDPKNWNNALKVTSLTLAFAFAMVATASAEMVNEEIAADAITPEPGLEEVVVIKKKKPTPVKARPRVVYQEEPAFEPASSDLSQYEPVAAAPAAATATARAQATAQAQSTTRAGVGGSIDQGIANKMDNVRGQFEEALLKTLDRIKITVDDGASAQATAVATAEATAVAPVAAPAPATPTVINDSIVNNQGSGAYLNVEQAPAFTSENAVADEEEGEEEESFISKFRVSPVIGKTFINSDFYKVDSRYTAGINLEMDVSDNLAGYLGYSYSQYDIGLGMGNPLYTGGFGNNGYMNGGNLQQLQYNQNLFEGGLRLYLFPTESKFRAHVGAGLGYNKGYLNYKQNAWNTWGGYNPYLNTTDYEVSSYLGLLETGAEIRVGKNVSVGALFKYATVLSSSENQPLNNYGFIQNGYNNQISQDQRVVGGSLARDSFYSILGTVKVAF